MGEVRRQVEAHRAHLGVPGLAVGIVHGEEVVFLEGFGDAESSGAEPIEPDTPFFLASLSKALTAVAVMQLVEDGTVALDAPVSTYLPELGPGAHVVSVRDLLHHRTGLSTYVGREPMFGELGDSLQVNVQRLGPSLRRDADFEYSNANYDTLALIVERASGIGFASFVHERVFEPLEMDNSFLDLDEATQAGLAQGHYHWLFVGYRAHDAPVAPGMAGSATMFSSAADLTRFLIAQLNAGAYREALILSPTSTDLLHEPVPYEQGSNWGYAMGWRVQPAFPPGVSDDARVADLTLVWHDGSWPTYYGMMWMVPEADLGFVMLANGNDLADETLLGQIGRDVRAIVFNLEPPGLGSQAPWQSRWGKQLLLALVLGQLLLAARTIPILTRIARGGGFHSGRAVIALATVLDVVVVIGIMWLARTAFHAPVTGGLTFPDFRILMVALGVGVAWGLIRTGVVAIGLVHGASMSSP
jgi:CubicO group peptidase (beta-lactamase class C family)